MQRYSSRSVFHRLFKLAEKGAESGIANFIERRLTLFSDLLFPCLRRRSPSWTEGAWTPISFALSIDLHNPIGRYAALSAHESKGNSPKFEFGEIMRGAVSSIWAC